MFPRHMAEKVGDVSFKGNWLRPRDAGEEAPLRSEGLYNSSADRL